MRTLDYNKRVAQGIKNSMKKGTTKVVTMEEYSGSSKDFLEACEIVGLEVVMNGYSIVVRK